jgi:hypothetical protein
MSAEGVQSRFDLSAFETEVTAADEARIVETMAECIDGLRDQIADDTLEEMFRSDPGRYTLRADFTRDRLDPEPLTKQRVIEPLLDALGYREYGHEAGGFSAERGEQADYAVALRDVDGVDSSRLLIEAEPVNKPLAGRGHGLDQVKSWLSQREFESDFGFATDGVRWIFLRYDPDAYSHDVIEEVDLRPVFLALFENAATASADPTDAIADEHRDRVAALLRSFAYGNFLSIVDDAREVIRQRQAEITDEFYDDYIRIVFGVADADDEQRTARSLVGDGVVSPDGADGEDVRQFAVDLMNRLIFIKFLEDKRIVRQDLLRTITDTYEDGVYPQSLYVSFLDPLFYDVLNEKPADRDPRIDDIDLYSGIPYLNGGLFRPELDGTEPLDERDFDVRDSVLLSVIELLERDRYSADGGPGDVDPSVLGNVFEKTITYLTTDPGDRNKELGAYYTPSEITRFCAERTVRPGLMEQFQAVLRDRGWPDAEVTQYGNLSELLEDLPGSGDLVTTLLSAMDDFSVLDPGMGSGHFLTSVAEEIVHVRQALYARMNGEDLPSRHRLKKTTILNNIYGVDIVGPAVEIGKLRLWLSVIAELAADDVETLSEDELALPNIAFNLRQGNSLIGFTGFPEESGNGEYTFERYQADSVRSRYEDIIEEIHKYRNAVTNGQADSHRRNAHERLERARDDLLDEIRNEFVAAGITDVTVEDIDSYSPFHWVLEFAEVFNAGGFDVIVGNPPWDVLTPNREEFFARYDPSFRTRPRDEKDEIQSDLLEDDEIADAWAAYRERMQRRADYFNDSASYDLQAPTIAGRTVPNNQNELSALFLERVYALAADGGHVAQVLPGTIFSGSNTKDVRRYLLDETDVRAIVGFENHGIFDGLHNQYKFGVAVFRNDGRTDVLRGTFQQRDPAILNDVRAHTIEIPRRVLAEFSPESGVFPFVTRQEEVGVLDEILEHPSLGTAVEDAWTVVPYRELDRSKDADYLVTDDSEGEYPIYEGKNVYQFSHDDRYVDLDAVSLWGLSADTAPDRSAKRTIRGKGIRDLKRAIYDAFDGDTTSHSQVQFVDELLERERGNPLSEADVLPDCTEYRIVIREVTNATNERTLVAAVIPEGAVCVHTLLTIRPYEINPEEDDLREVPLHGVYDRVFSDRELFVALGLLNSLPFDFLMRTKVDSHIVMYKLRESQMPRLTAGEEWFEYVWRRAARLNCYGDAFAAMRDRLGGIDPATDPEERRSIQAQLDAAAFHAYGLDRDQTAFVLEDFHRVTDPRVMTAEYFDLVQETYDELSR